MLPERLADEIRAGLVAAGVHCPAEIPVARPLRPEHGDYSSPAALRVGRPSGRSSRALAEQLAARLRRANGVGRVAIEGAGHLNIWLAPDGLAAAVRRLAGDRAASANPSGPPDDETVAHLAMLLRGAEALGVRPDDLEPDDLAGTEQRHLICLLAETTDLAGRRPDRRPRRAREIRAAWERVEAVQPILPMGDAPPDARHATGRLLAAATYNVLSTYRSP